jgi:hypothetical protein
MRQFALIGLMGLALSAPAQESVASLLDLNGAARSLAPTASATVGEATADLIPGNGTRGGYTTRYAPIIPYSESVYVDGKRLQRDLDYWIDYASGSDRVSRSPCGASPPCRSTTATTRRASARAS